MFVLEDCSLVVAAAAAGILVAVEYDLNVLPFPRRNCKDEKASERKKYDCRQRMIGATRHRSACRVFIAVVI